jgi:hypothetical protein
VTAQNVPAEWNATGRPIPALPIHAGVERYARERPDFCAADAIDGRLTYGELNA